MQFVVFATVMICIEINEPDNIICKVQVLFMEREHIKNQKKNFYFSTCLPGKHLLNANKRKISKKLNVI